MSKKKEEKLKQLDFISVGLKKIGNGYYQIISVSNYTDGTFDIINISHDMSINYAEEDAIHRLLELSLELQK